MGQQFLNRIRYYLDSLQRFAKSEHPLMLILGQQGSGKRPLLDALSQELPDTFRQLNVECHADLTPQDLIDFLCEQWQLQQDPSTNSPRAQLDCLLRQISHDQQHNIILCNNAQNLTLATLAALSHLASQQENPPVAAHIILAGENELEDKINSLMAQTPPRLLMQPLSRKETFHYIKYRIAKLGNGHTLSPSTEVMEEIYNQSGGFPSLINHITQKWICETVLDTKEIPEQAPLIDNEPEHAEKTQEEEDVPIKRLKEHYQKDSKNFWQQHTIKITATVCLALLAVGLWIFHKEPLHKKSQPVFVLIHNSKSEQHESLPKSITIQSLAAITGTNPTPTKTTLAITEKSLSKKTNLPHKKQPAKVHIKTLKKPYFTIQLIASNQLPRVEKFRKDHHLIHHSDIIWLRKNSTTWYALVTGKYPNKEKALTAMKSLPTPLKLTHPWIKEIH